jgi:hypothetical protein
VPGARHGHAHWLAPLAAAACVVAIAATLVAIRQAQHGAPAPSPTPSSAGVVPRYYVALSHPPDTATPNQVIVGNAATGRVLSRVAPPAGTTFAGVAGAADDRTFIVEAQPFPQPLPGGGAGRSADPTISGDGYTATTSAVTLPRTFYLLRVSPSASGPTRLTRAPVPEVPAGAEVTALALSPDGSKLALAILPHVDPNAYKSLGLSLQVLRVYSVATGAVLGTWSTSRGEIDSYDYTPDNGTEMTWLPDGNHLAFFVNSDAAGLRVLDVRSPGGDLATAGTRLTTSDISNCNPAWPTMTSPVLLTPDGTTLVCGWYDVVSSGFAGGGRLDCPATTLLAGLAEYSLSAPSAAAAASRVMWHPWRPSRTLASYRVTGHCAPDVLPQLAWSSPHGDEVIAYLASPGPGWALYRPGGFTPLRVASVPDPHYVAW